MSAGWSCLVISYCIWLNQTTIFLTSFQVKIFSPYYPMSSTLCHAPPICRGVKVATPMDNTLLTPFSSGSPPPSPFCRWGWGGSHGAFYFPWLPLLLLVVSWSWHGILKCHRPDLLDSGGVFPCFLSPMYLFHNPTVPDPPFTPVRFSGVVAVTSTPLKISIW